MAFSHQPPIPPSDVSSEYWQWLGSGLEHDIPTDENGRDDLGVGFDYLPYHVDYVDDTQYPECWSEMNFDTQYSLPSEPDFSTTSLDPPSQLDCTMTDFYFPGGMDFSPSSDLPTTTTTAVTMDQKPASQDPPVAVAAVEPYACDHCARAFPRACDLKKHLRKHTLPVECLQQGCSEKFPHPRERDRHVKAKHKVLLTEKDFRACWICSRPFTRTDALKRHLQRVHSVSVSFRAKSGDGGSPATASLSSSSLSQSGR
jgi:hypothetical protein